MTGNLLWFVVLGAVVVLALLMRAGAAKRAAFPYRLQNALFSPAERAFLHVLQQAVTNECLLFGKVRVADVLAVDRRMARGKSRSAFSRICAKHFDYVLCDPDDLSILCAIELDDQSHQRPDRQERDQFLDTACAVAGVPLLHFPVRKTYSVAEVREHIQQALCGAPQTSGTAHPAPRHDEAPARRAASPRPVAGVAATASVVPICPQCGAPMVQRQARTGAHAGEFFWACSTYPRCRCIRNLDAGS